MWQLGSTTPNFTLEGHEKVRAELKCSTAADVLSWNGKFSAWRDVEIVAFAEIFFFFCQIFVHTHCTCGVGTKLLNPFFIYQGVNCVDYFHGGEKPYLISGADDRLVKIWDYQVSSFLTFCGLILWRCVANMLSTCLLENQRKELLWLESGTFKLFVSFV